MNNLKKDNQRKKDDLKNRVIQRQTKEIESLKDIISKLEIEQQEKDKLIASVDEIRKDLLQVVNELKEKSNEYDKLISELSEMRNAMNEVVFNGKWKLIRFLMK